MSRTLRALVRNEAFVTDTVYSVREEHELGRPPFVEVVVGLGEPIPLDDIVGTNSEVHLGYEEEDPRLFRGRVEWVELQAQSLDDGNPHVYRLHIVCNLALLDGSVRSAIFQERSVPEIVTTVLEEHGIAADQLDFRLNESYPQREYCVQYQESALAFVSRLLEAEGIYYHLEPADSEAAGMRIIFSDDSTLAEKQVGERLPLRARSGLIPSEDAVYVLEPAEALVPGKTTLRDYDFLHPSLDLEVSASASEYEALEIYDYPGEYTDSKQGQRLAQVRLDEAHTERRSCRIEARCPALSVGRILKIEDFDQETEYLVTSVCHDFKDKGVSGSLEEGESYAVSAHLIPASVKFRPARSTPRPVIHGLQTAQVVAPEGAEMEEIHTDEHGRCKVKFHWDLADEHFDKASCWMRVTQLQSSGSMILPRVHWEVIVEFLEGNPDRPVVTGHLYNGMFMPPYALPEGATRTSLGTCSSPGGGGKNEIRFEDKAGSEEIAVSSQYNTEVGVANNRKREIGANDTLTIGVDSTTDVGADQETKVTSGYQCSVTGSQTMTISGARTVEVNAVAALTVGDTAETTVTGTHFEMNGSPLAGLLSLAAATAADAAKAKANQAIGQVQGMVQGKVAQAMGPINSLTGQVQNMGAQAMQKGNLASSMGMIGAASGLSGATSMATSLAGGPAALKSAGGVADPAGIVSATNALTSQATSALGSAIAGAPDALGMGSGGAGGSSQENVAGPEGAVGGVSEADSTTGPGHAQYKLSADHTEDTGAARVMAVAGGVNLNIQTSRTQTVGAAYVELAASDHAESVEGIKSESEAALVVLSKGGESENVSGARVTMIGGARIQKIKGSYQIESKAAAGFVGALHKWQAKGKLTLKCGASSVVIDGGGVTITSPTVSISAGSMKLTKAVSDD